MELNDGGDEFSITLQEIAENSQETIADFTEDTDLVEEVSMPEVFDEVAAEEEKVDAIVDSGLTVDDESTTEKIEQVKADAIDINLINIDNELDSSEELMELVDDADHEFEIIIDESVENANVAETETEGMLDIDPMLLKIYHDESQGYLETIRQLIDESELENQRLKIDKNLIRAFHTLYGSARTAEVGPIADLSGLAEKYIKVRQEGGEDNIPDEVVAVFKEIERTISGMLSEVEDGRLPDSNKVLQDKIHKIVQHEIQTQLQKSWQDNTATKEQRITESNFI